MNNTTYTYSKHIEIAQHVVIFMT